MCSAHGECPIDGNFKRSGKKGLELLLKHLWTFKVLADQGPFTGHFPGGLIFPHSSWLSNEAALSPVCTSGVLMAERRKCVAWNWHVPCFGHH